MVAYFGFRNLAWRRTQIDFPPKSYKYDIHVMGFGLKILCKLADVLHAIVSDFLKPQQISISFILERHENNISN